MNEKELKTSLTQRIIIIVVAVLLLGSTVFAYLFIVMSGSSSSDSGADDAKLAEIEEAYNAKVAEAGERAEALSDKYFDTFVKYKSKVKAYNKNTANSEGLKTVDLKEGDGKQLKEEDYDYFSYYIGWCADGEIFDSSLNDVDNPTGLSAPLEDTSNTIAGWREGVVGMKLGGVREITMNGDLAYGDTREICGGTGSPLKFIVMAVETDAELAKLYEDLNSLYLQYSMLSGGSATY